MSTCDGSRGPAGTTEKTPEESVRGAPVWKTGRKKGRSRLRKRISRNLGYAGLRMAHAVVCRLPWRVGRALAWIAGTVAYRLLKRERDIATQSLTRVYGKEKSAAQIQAVVRDVFRHAASVVTDWVILRRWTREKLRGRFPQVAETLETVARDMRASGKGTVAITAHLGNWELLAHSYCQFAPGILVPLAKRLYFEKYNDFVHSLRAEPGLEVIYSDESARKMLRALKEGKQLSFLCDQDLRTNSGVFVDFFGLPTYTVTFPVDMARKTGVDLVFTVLVREGSGYRQIYHRFGALPETGDESEDVLQATQAWTRFLEGVIRQYPGQWVWLHPRWRTTPDNPRLQFDSKGKRGREGGEERDRGEEKTVKGAPREGGGAA
ncbi:MAG: lysophospholipid acyltransferase family protein [Planctomycetes bacterium]|nr:lysophospholipid acyltransferase family protein [Planctomycetota bacterium]